MQCQALDILFLTHALTDSKSCLACWSYLLVLLVGRLALLALLVDAEIAAGALALLELLLHLLAARPPVLLRPAARLDDLVPLVVHAAVRIVAVEVGRRSVHDTHKRVLGCGPCRPATFGVAHCLRGPVMRGPAMRGPAMRGPAMRGLATRRLARLARFARFAWAAWRSGRRLCGLCQERGQNTASAQ